MALTIHGYAGLVDRLLALAEELCGGRIVFTLEGGYHLEVLAHSVLNTLRQLSRSDEPISDPLGPCPWGEHDASAVLAQVRAGARLGK